MSRIHEALKKAEEERAAAQIAGAAALPIPVSAGPSARENGTTCVPTEVCSPASPTEPALEDFLRFDDLRVHCAHPRWRLDPNVNIFFDSALSPHGAEQFRALRSRLYQLRGNGQKTLRTLLITSALPAEGKTFVANNLAQAFVRQPDRRALLIDGDLRCSRMHIPLGAPSAPGLTDYLRGETDEKAVIQHGQEGNLCFIAGGNEVTNPSELLLNGRMKTLLDRVAPVFDWVVLDSPPSLPVTDASVLADLCDAVLVVVQAGSTPSEIVQRACQDFRERNLIGIVLNRAREGAGYGQGSYYYHHSGNDGDKLR